MKKLAPVALLMIAAVSASATPAAAQEFRPLADPPVRVGERLEPQSDVAPSHVEFLRPALMVVVRALKLDEFQVETSIQLLIARRQAVLPLAREIAVREQALKELIGSDAPNPAEIGVLVLQIRELKRGIASHHQTFLEAFVGQLDEDQHERLARINLAAEIQPVLPAFKKLGLI